MGGGIIYRVPGALHLVAEINLNLCCAFEMGGGRDILLIVNSNRSPAPSPQQRTIGKILPVDTSFQLVQNAKK